MDEISEEIKNDSKRLFDLLNEPHPGLASWQMFLAQVAKRLRDNLNQKLEE